MIKQPSVDWLITQMKIIGGAEMYAYHVMLELFRRGWDIRLITIVDDQILSPQLQQQGIPVLSLSAKSKIEFGVWRRLEKIWKRKKPKILHTHLFHAGILGRLVGRKVGIPIILCHQGGPENNRPLHRTILDFLTSPLVDRYVVPCEAVRKILHRRENIPIRKIDLLPNGIRPPSELHSVIERSMDQFSTPVRLITVGRLVPEKAQDVMICSVNIMAMRNFLASLTIIGEGPKRTELERQIQQLNLSASVYLPGHQDNPFEWLQQADIFVLTSLWESLSLALMEAMVLGLPVIATATGGTPELITHLQNGYLIPPNSPEALADAIEFLVHHPDVARQLGENARKLILENYTIPKIVDQLESYYREILEGKALL